MPHTQSTRQADLATEPRILVTKRLTLRPVLEVDADDIFEWLQEPQIVNKLAGLPHPYTRDDAIAFANSRLPLWLRNEERTLAIVRERMIGTISIRSDGDIGYWLAKPYWGAGIMGEALQAAIRFAFDELGYKTLTARVAEGNEASAALLLRNGFTETGAAGTCGITSVSAPVAATGFALSRAAFESAVNGGNAAAG